MGDISIFVGEKLILHEEYSSQLSRFFIIHLSQQMQHFAYPYEQTLKCQGHVRGFHLTLAHGGGMGYDSNITYWNRVGWNFSLHFLCRRFLSDMIRLKELHQNLQNLQYHIGHAQVRAVKMIILLLRFWGW